MVNTAQNQLFQAAVHGNTYRVRQLLGAPTNSLWNVFFQDRPRDLNLDVNSRLNDQEIMIQLMWSIRPNQFLSTLGYRSSTSSSWYLYRRNGVAPLGLAVIGGHNDTVRALL